MNIHEIEKGKKLSSGLHDNLQYETHTYIEFKAVSGNLVLVHIYIY